MGAVRPVERADADAWVAMRGRLWPDGDEDHAGEVARFFAGDTRIAEAVLLAVDDDGTPVGFVELSIRSHAEGCETDRVAYVEGWFVEARWRGKGVGRALIGASERWAVERGCTEIASDAKVDNEQSIAAHGAVGFEEAGRNVAFRKRVGGDSALEAE